MASRLNWSNELKKIIIDDILRKAGLFRIEYDDEKRIKEISRKYSLENIVKTFEENIKNDKIVERIIEEFRRKVSSFIEEKLENFNKSQGFFLENIRGITNKNLELLNSCLYDLAYEKLTKNQYEERQKYILQEFVREVEQKIENIYNHYQEGFQKITNELSSYSLRLSGFLSIYYSLKSVLKTLWDRDKDLCIRFSEDFQIENNPIQLWFCEFIYNDIDFLNDEYSTLYLFEHSEKLELNDEDYLYFCSASEEEEKALERIVGKVCSNEEFRQKGGMLYSFLKKFKNAFEFRRDISYLVIKQMYNFLVVQNGVLEYEIFRNAALSGYPCLPRVLLYCKRQPYKEIDLLLLNDNKLFLIEITFRKDFKKCEEKLQKVSELLSERLSGIELIPCIISRDNFEEFIKEIKFSLKEGIEKMCQKL